LLFYGWQKQTAFVWLHKNMVLKNNDKYLEILKTSWLIDGIIPDSNKEENIKSFLYKIFTS